MANQLYGYNPSSYSGGGGESADRRSVYSSRSNADSSLRGSSKYLDSDNYAASSRSSYYSSSMLFNHTDSAAGGYSGMSTRIPGVSVTTSQLASWPGPPGVDAGAAASSSSVDPLLASLKRHSYEALYHQNLLGAHSTIGQSESWLSTNPLAKRPRFDHASNLPIYPQRPGEKDCAHYMLTRTCKFGDSCIFDHPIWVPEGGIPDWKEVPLYATHDSLPERPGLPDCPYFLKTQRCKYGPRCKFNHPRDAILPLSALEDSNVSSLPERPSEPPCVFYMKTGKCKFGATCKFHHPKDIQAPLAEQENGSILQALAVSSERVQPLVTPALLHNSKGLPIRPDDITHEASLLIIQSTIGILTMPTTTILSRERLLQDNSHDQLQIPLKRMVKFLDKYVVEQITLLLTAGTGLIILINLRNFLMLSLLLRSTIQMIPLSMWILEPLHT